MDRSEYTIGWLCALPIERAMAVAVLDKQHADLPQLANDLNSYAFGSIGPHNIVIACLPAGSTGIGAAATVAAQMLPAFPSLRFGVLVGVGGGAPSEEHDIRLGDVVVSQPSDKSGGIIQYDSGKMLQDGHFERTGSLNEPPPALLTALASLQANHLLKPPSISHHISLLLSKYPHLEETASYQEARNDILFKSEYVHNDKNDLRCDMCDRKSVVERKQRASQEPRIFYGLVASGNMVMRDSLTRDRLQKEHKILCFEMEAAGLMNAFPCLVVRGICDYSDSHKNKQWQQYAAATAAGYAKELLNVVQPAAVSQTPLASEQVTMQNIHFRRNPSFLGRKSEIQSLKSKIFTDSSVRRVALYGLGGVGKTQIALELAYQLLEAQPDYPIFWVVGTDITTLEQSYLEIANHLGIDTLSNKQAEVKLLVQQRLNRPDFGKWLMIVDNADDKQAWFKYSDHKIDEAALVNSLPSNNDGSIIFTTRSREVAVEMAGTNSICVKEMPTREAEDLFKSLLLDENAIDDYEKLSMLVKELCCLPLALSQAAAYINKKMVPVSKYFSLMQTTESELIEILSENFQDQGRYPQSRNPVAVTWWISFEQIQQNDSLAAEYLSVLSCLEPTKIPRVLLPVAKSEKEATDAIGTLKSFSFIVEQTVQYIIDSKPVIYEVFDMHRLVRMATRNWLRKSNELHKWTDIAMDRLMSEYPDNDYRFRELWALFWPHARQTLADLTSDSSELQACVLMQKVYLCLYADGKYGEAAVIQGRALKICQRFLGDEHPDTITVMNDLAITLNNQGKLNEAALIEREVLEKSKRILGDEHPNTISTMNNIAVTLGGQGKLNEAVLIQREVLEKRKRILGDEHPDTIMAMGNLAVTISEQGKYNEAALIQREVLEKRTRILGDEHPETLQTMGHLACILSQEGKPDEAALIHREVLEKSKRILGDEHPGTIAAMSNLVITLGDQGKPNELALLKREVLEKSKRILGDEHLDTMITMNNLASTLRAQGKLNEAIGMQEEVVKKMERALGEDHPNSTTARRNLAIALNDQTD